MRTRTRAQHAFRPTVYLVAAVMIALALAGYSQPAQAAAPASPPAAACVVTPGAVTCDLWAKTGTVTLPGPVSVPIWGYTDSAVVTPTVPGGPTIIVQQGDVVTITLHNDLAEPSSLAILGSGLIPDTTGAAAAGTKTYNFTASQAGSFLYEAGLTADGQRQVAMGLFGAFIVRPTFTFTGISVARTDTGATFTSGSNIVNDSVVLASDASDVGAAVSGAGIPAGTTITAVAAGSFTQSSNATANGSGVVITRIDAAATVASGSATVTDLAVLASDVGSAVSGAGIPSGTTITAATAGASFTLSAAAQPAAYGASTAFDDEAVLVLSEIDPAFNANPATFDMRFYAPKYWLINGQAHPDIPSIGTLAGHKVLLRYLNAGLNDHSVGLLGLHQTVIAADGHLLPYVYQMVAETVPAGETLDAITSVPAGAPFNFKFVLYNAAEHLDNAGGLNGGLI